MVARIGSALILVVLLGGVISLGAAREIPSSTLLDRVGGWAAAMLQAVASIAFMTMSLVQLGKELLPLRAVLHRRLLQRWLAGTLRYTRDFDSQSRLSLEPDGMLRYLFRQSAQREILGLPSEQLCGQLNAALELALAERSERDIAIVRAIIAPFDSREIDRYLEGLQSGETSGEEDQSKRTRVVLMVQRRMDALQIRLAGEWRRALRGASVLVSFAIATVGVLLFSPLTLSAAGFVCLASVFSGFFASVARDLVAWIEGLRR
jgi:hypothetical protein